MKSPTCDQYHRASPARLGLAVTTEHPAIDPRDPLGPLFAHLDRLAATWTDRLGLAVRWEAVGLMVGRRGHKIEKLAIARDADQYEVAPSASLGAIIAAADQAAVIDAFATLRSATRRESARV